jgi:predicted O-linked N-acetylglucosamine transferase (SPINDLY family)
MGVPTVTLAGPIHASRVGVSLLNNIGLAELVAENPQRYVQIAVELAGDAMRLQTLRANLRSRMSASPLMDASRFARSIESAYRRAWNAWCAAAT